MKKISLIIFNTLLFFILINLLISISWPIFSKFKATKHNYIKEQIDNLKLSEKDLNILFKESWLNENGFRYVPFIGHTETKRVGKFLNFDEVNGRKVNRPDSCNFNIYLYGGSTQFGYNVPDDYTIAEFLQKKLGNEYCVYNHGRGYFYSKQENSLFVMHIENEKKIDSAIFLDGVNERCGGYEYANFINNSFSLLTEKPYKVWMNTSIMFIYSLPIINLYNSLFNKFNWVHDTNNNILNIDSCSNQIPLESLFETRVNIRHAICLKENIKCHTLLQPFAGAHGVQIEELLTLEKKKSQIKKYEKLKKVSKNVLDISDVFDDDTKLSYIDGLHYTPNSNMKIANRIALLF